MELDNRIFSKRLKLLMKTYKVTYDLLVEYVNLAFESDQIISKTSVHRWVMDKRVPNMLSVVAISVVFGVSSDWLIGISSEPYTLESLNMQEKISKNVDADIRSLIDYDLRRDGPWNLMCAAEALFIYNFLCLHAQKIWRSNKELTGDEVYSLLFFSNENMVALLQQFFILIETNKPYFDLRKAMRNEKRCS